MRNKNIQVCDITTQKKADLSKHCGRIRAFPHERGNWATFIFITRKFWRTYKICINLIFNFIDERNDSILILQQNIIDAVQTECNLKLYSHETLHISLSKTVVIKFHWIQSFIECFKKIGFDTKRCSDSSFIPLY